MRLLLVVTALALIGCKHRGPEVGLREGAQRVPIAGCPFEAEVPAGSTTALPDDGAAKVGSPSALHLGFAGDPQTSISIVWRTRGPATGTRVEFGTAALDRSARGYSFAYPADGEAVPSVRIHEVHLCNLQPGTAYRYRIAGTAMGGRFATAPAEEGRPLRFAVAGDSRDDPASWGLVAQALAASAPELLLYSGDAVSSGSQQTEWDAWFDAARTVLPSLPIIPALGNHEASARQFRAQFALPGNERWFSFDYGDVHFVVLHDSPANAAELVEQARFLDADLGATRRRWKVVMHHRGIYSSSEHGSQADLQALWMPLYDKHGVDVVFNGHDHDYERTWPMRGGVRVPDGQGTTYVVNGGGGAPLYRSGVSPFTAFSRSTYGYSLVDVAGNSMTLSAFSVEGTSVSRMDQITLKK